MRQELVAERPAPVKTTGFVGLPAHAPVQFADQHPAHHRRALLLLWFTVIPALKFLLVDAVWQGTDRNACLAENAGHPVGACWPFVAAKFTQLIYGFYPESERWRVNLTFFLAALVAAAAADSAPAGQGAQRRRCSSWRFRSWRFSCCMAAAFSGFGVSWTADVLSGLADSIADARPWADKRGRRPGRSGRCCCCSANSLCCSAPPSPV